ncbi:regulatory protein RecX [Actinopolymorpha alba]|uniref:regulatory protein RecX n=1 Tax=Actinopolymorpha alba TaxID=533267 RepID=UPI000376AB11|nr:regulatory protein RecX [Actinopolymorpha alba]
MSRRAQRGRWSRPDDEAEGAGAAEPRASRRTRRQAGAGGEPEGSEADPEQLARTIVLRQLTAQPRSRAELAQALRRRGVPEDVIERVLARFSDVGLIDDAAFARAWVDSRHVGRGLARRALAHELRRRGVGDEEVGDAVDQLSPETELATARSLVARRLPSTRGLDARIRVRRLASMLARKGYPPTLALRVVREALADEAGEHERAAVEEFASAVDAMDGMPDGDVE